MSALFDRLAASLVEGHRREIPDLLSDARFADADRTAQAAVLIAITDRPQPGLILTQRPQGMRDHPGQVAFPGGKLNPGEDAVTAALREAHEELSLDPQNVRVIGATDRYHTGTGFDITPIVAVVPPDLDLTPDPREVEAWFEAPLSLLLRSENWQEQEVFWRGNTRKYLELHYKGFRIWGVTAAIIANLSRRIGTEGQIDER
ncbi:MAG: coenzyme A pyrophosphatase [Sphingomonadales bacterium BRH_c42]|nr:MAG: coenzyme A pyrophosphatase [Sphingomonadales bacterium BRH_c42]